MKKVQHKTCTSLQTSCAYLFINKNHTFTKLISISIIYYMRCFLQSSQHTYVCMILSLMGSTGKHLKWKELYYAFLMRFHYWVNHKMTTHNCYVGKAFYIYMYITKTCRGQHVFPNFKVERDNSNLQIKLLMETDE